jgi:hypothetical protein
VRSWLVTARCIAQPGATVQRRVALAAQLKQGALLRPRWILWSNALPLNVLARVVRSRFFLLLTPPATAAPRILSYPFPLDDLRL